MTPRHINERQPGDARPDRAVCRHCARILEREVGSEVWTVSRGPGLEGRDPECFIRPNPEDGPVPSHEPDGVIVHPPGEE